MNKILVFLVLLSFFFNPIFMLETFSQVNKVPEIKKDLIAVKTEDQELLDQAKEFFEPLPDSIVDKKNQKAKIDLGKKLYFQALSPDDTISCNSCHRLEDFGVDHQSVSPGFKKQKGSRNSPTVYNAALQFAQFWDGRAKDVEEQALGPILNPIEHGMPDQKAVIEKLMAKGYREAFQQAFPTEKDPLTFKNVGIAIGTYERTLLTPSRFDDYLNGKAGALSALEKKGLKRFINLGCVSCHNGLGIGGGMFQKLGLVENYKTKDPGLFAITKNPEEKHFFKVPSLRNVEKTYPYFHDGSLQTLEEVIPIMARYQLGEKVSREDIEQIKGFLSSLTAKKLEF